jgi:molybdopterin converting factor small subunit
MRVRVQLFGRAAEQAGEREIGLELPEGSTMRAAAERLQERCPRLQALLQISRPARNLEYVSWEAVVADGDEISFIPPVSGG